MSRLSHHRRLLGARQTRHTGGRSPQVSTMPCARPCSTLKAVGCHAPHEYASLPGGLETLQAQANLRLLLRRGALRSDWPAHSRTPCRRPGEVPSRRLRQPVNQLPLHSLQTRSVRLMAWRLAQATRKSATTMHVSFASARAPPPAFCTMTRCTDAAVGLVLKK